MRPVRVLMVASASASVVAAGWVVGELVSSQTSTVVAQPQAPSPTAPADASSSVPSVASSATASSEAPAQQTGASGTFTGAAFSNARGTFQAAITVEDGVITAVDALSFGTDERDSQRINEKAVPALTERVLAAQTWNVDAVSGASFTSEGLTASIKDAMTQAGLS